MKPTAGFKSSSKESQGGQQFLKVLYEFHDLYHKIPVSIGERQNRFSPILRSSKPRSVWENHPQSGEVALKSR
jgi:hypothetical protein